MRIIIADRRPSVRSALRMVLEHDVACESITEATDTAEILDALPLGPDLLLLEWDLPGLPSVELVGRLRAEQPELSIVALSDHLRAKGEAFRSGANCFINTTEPPPNFLELLHSLCPDVAEQLRAVQLRRASARAR